MVEIKIANIKIYTLQGFTLVRYKPWALSGQNQKIFLDPIF